MTCGKIQIGIDFILLLATFFVIDTDGLFVLALLAAAVHELGHIIAMKIFGVKIEHISLSAYGAQIQMCSYPMISYKKEIVIALAGPLLGGIFALVLGRVGNNESCTLIAGFSLILTVLNLLPTTPLDGGRVLKYAMLATFDEKWQVPVSKIGNVISALLLVCLCLAVTFKVGISPSLCAFTAFTAGSFLKELFE